MIDANVAAAARLAEEPAIGPLEDDMLGALEAHDVTYRAFADTRRALAPLFERVLSAWLYPGAEINIHDRTKRPPRCLVLVRIGSGNARNASRFRIVGKPAVTVDSSGDPASARWSVRAVAISGKTGKDMSGNTPNRRTTTDGTVTLTGHVFEPGHLYDDMSVENPMQIERDAFMRMVAEAEAILAKRRLHYPDPAAPTTQCVGCDLCVPKPGEVFPPGSAVFDGVNIRPLTPEEWGYTGHGGMP